MGRYGGLVLFGGLTRNGLASEALWIAQTCPTSGGNLWRRHPAGGAAPEARAYHTLTTLEAPPTLGGWGGVSPPGAEGGVFLYGGAQPKPPPDEAIEWVLAGDPPPGRGGAGGGYGPASDWGFEPPLNDLWRWSSSSGWALLGDAPTAGVDARAARGAWPPARREHAAAPCSISREGDDEFDDDDDALRAAQCFYIFGGLGAFSPLSRPPPHHLPHTTP